MSTSLEKFLDDQSMDAKFYDSLDPVRELLAAHDAAVRDEAKREQVKATVKLLEGLRIGYTCKRFAIDSIRDAWAKDHPTPKSGGVK